MAIKFKYDKNGNLVAVDENDKKVGAVTTMGDLTKDEKTPKSDKSKKA